MKQMLFYENLLPLNREKHKNLYFKPLADYRFSAVHNSVPLAGPEFFEASRDMAVLFNKDKDGKFFPLALLSLRSDGHEMLDENGLWKGSYMPSYIQRYPFAQTQEGNILFDESCSAFSDTGDKEDALFDEEGKNSKRLDSIIHFLQQYDTAMKATIEFCDALAERDFLRPFNAEIGSNTENPQRVQGLYGIDQKKLAELKGRALEIWFKKSWLAWSYAHLHSLGALRMLPRNPVSSSKKESVTVKNPKM